MENKWQVFAMFMLILLIAGSGCAPEELPSASLWGDGAWALYKQTRVDIEGREISGSLKISSVGKEMVENKLYHWIEIREDNEDGVIITKFLTAENPTYNQKEGFKFWSDIKRIIIQENSQTPEEIPLQHLKRYSPTFVESSKSKRFGNVKDQHTPEFTELPEIKLTINNKEISGSGFKSKRIYTSSVNLGFLNLEDTTESTTSYFTNPEVPFGGLIKVIHSSKTLSLNKLKPEEQKPPQSFENTLVCTAYGKTGAETQIIGEPVEKQVMPFPFLKGGQKK